VKTEAGSCWRKLPVPCATAGLPVNSPPDLPDCDSNWKRPCRNTQIWKRLCMKTSRPEDSLQENFTTRKRLFKKLYQTTDVF